MKNMAECHDRDPQTLHSSPLLLYGINAGEIELLNSIHPGQEVGESAHVVASVHHYSYVALCHLYYYG